MQGALANGRAVFTRSTAGSRVNWRHGGMAARNNLAPTRPLASCLRMLDKGACQSSVAAQASQCAPVYFLLVRAINGCCSTTSPTAPSSVVERAPAQRTATLLCERQLAANGQRRSKGFCRTAYRFARPVHH